MLLKFISSSCNAHTGSKLPENNNRHKPKGHQSPDHEVYYRRYASE